MKPKKIERLHKRKEVLDLITEKARQYSELVELVNFSESTLKRVLEELEKLGLIENEGHYWRRRGYKYPKEYTLEEYNAAVGHTQDLLPGFDALLEINTQALLEEREKLFENRFFQDHFDSVTPQDQITHARQERLFLSTFVEQHLKFYPEIHSNLIKFRMLSKKIEELNKGEVAKFIEKFKNKIFGPDRFVLLNWKQKESSSRLRKLLGIPEQKMFRENIPYALGPFETEDELAEATKFLHNPSIIKQEVDANSTLHLTYSMDEKTSLKKKINYFILGPVSVEASNEKMINDFVDTVTSLEKVYGDLAKEIHILKLQSQRQPLDGYCDLCPNLIVKKKKNL